MNLKFSRGLLPRDAAWQILQAVNSGAYTDVAIDRVFRKYTLTEIDKALVTELSCGAIRRRQSLDYWIDYLARISALKQPPLLRLLLHLGLYQIFYMDRIPASAAVNTSVELAKRNGLGRLSSVVNAVLRKAIKARDSGDQLPKFKGASQQLSQAYSIPNWLAKELIKWRGQSGAENIAQAFNCTPTIDLRVNCRRVSREILHQKFQDAGIQTMFIDGCANGLTVKTRCGDLRDWPGYIEGEWSVQDRSAQWVSPLLEVKPGELVLDACAAPGGKTTHLAELMDDMGEIWAVDSSSQRIKRISMNAARLGLNCIKCFTADATNLLADNPSLEKYFHRILLDAPCSGLGTLARNPDARWRMSETKIKHIVKIQANLLQKILPLLRPGGRIVYSTCTIHPEENSKQIQRFLSRNNQLKLMAEKQIWPGGDFGGDGFYAAIIDSI